MRMRSIWLAAIVLPGLGCSGGGAAPPAAPPPAPAPPGPAAPPAPTGTRVVRDASGATGPFRLGSLQRLFLDSSYAGNPGPHAMRVDLVAPSGDTFGSLPHDLDADAGGKATATQRLEVRGTRIHLYHLVGSWRFVLIVDGAPLASASVDVVD